VIIKPAPESPLDAYVIAEEIQQAGFPEGVVSIIPAGREIGEYLVSHPGIDKVAFTGSTAAGRRIGAICGENITRVTLELGGKSAAIVLDDADLDRSLPILRDGAMANNGQICSAITRFLVPRDRYDEIAGRLCELVSAMRVGDPFEKDTEIGPLVAERQRTRVEGYIASGRAEGARVLTGGGRPAGLDHGWYVEPTVFGDVRNEMRIAREEIFGPVVALIPYGDENEAVKIANDSSYGLSGAVFTQDHERGLRIARQIRTGTYTVDDFKLDLTVPFGGYKCSGIGRECGPEGMEAYLEYKSIGLPQGFVPVAL
jgi:aldehyde dehydrogenase (NAD+)